MAEPGRALVADAGVLESEVVLVSDARGSRWVYLDVGLFSGLVEAYDESVKYRLEVRRDGSPRPVRPGGPGRPDLRQPGHPVPAASLPAAAGPAAGDRCRFLSAGAYTASYSSVGSTGSRRSARNTGDARSVGGGPTFRSALRGARLPAAAGRSRRRHHRPAGADPRRRHRGAGPDVVGWLGVGHRRARFRAVRDLLRLRRAARRPLVPQRGADLVVRHPGRLCARCSRPGLLLQWSVPLLVLLAAAAAVLATPSYPALAAATVQCVPDGPLPAANALVTGVENATWIAGPGVLGLILLAGQGPASAPSSPPGCFSPPAVLAARVQLPRPPATGRSGAWSRTGGPGWRWWRTDRLGCAGR